MKRIVICMDGTWQSLNQDAPTNVAVIASSVAHKETRPEGAYSPKDGAYVHQVVIYTSGVGSTIGALQKRGFFAGVSASINRFAGGVFGEGLEDGILDTYLRLAFNYEEGDQIFIFGFSRGAFAARRLSGLIASAGIVSRLHVDRAREAFRLYYDQPLDSAPDSVKKEWEEAARNFRRVYGKGRRKEDGAREQTDTPPPIAYMGVFDTVAQRGIGDILLGLTPWGNPYRYRFKNYRISRNVEAARHAVAVDENRFGFPALLWDNIEEANARAGREAFGQRWFIGRHGDVGGGDGSKLAALALKWVAEGAAQAGLRFYDVHGPDSSPLHDALRDSGLRFDYPISRTKFAEMWLPVNYPWRRRKIWRRRERPSMQDIPHCLDDSVMARMQAEQLHYRPPQLRPFRQYVKDWRPISPHSAAPVVSAPTPPTPQHQS